jgi:hypothetical protein
MSQVFLEESASFNLCAHSSQHTSTALPPIVTLMALASSLQSHAAHVFSTMTSTSMNGLLSVNLDREMGGAQRHQKVLRIEDVAGGEDARPPGVPGHDTLRPVWP